MNEHDRRIQAAYARLQSEFPFEGYVESASKIGLDVADLLLDHCPEGGRVLEFGAGASDKIALLHYLGFECAGCDDLQDEWHLEDQNRDAILAFNRRLGIDFTPLVDGNLPDYPVETFEAVTILDVLEHWHCSPRELLNGLIRLLKPGGLLVVGMPNSVNLRKRISTLLGRTNYCSLESFYFSGNSWRGHVREYTLRETEKLVEYQGLDLVSSRMVHAMVDLQPRLKNSFCKACYMAVTRLFPRLRDSVLVAGRKPADWKPVSHDHEIAAKYFVRPQIKLKAGW